MNPAPAHLEAKLRFGWDFTVGQLAVMFCGILIAFAWVNWLSPIAGIGGLVSGVYIGGLPVAAGLVASQTEFDLWSTFVAAARWRRSDGRFTPGPAASSGYVVLIDADGRRGEAVLGELDLDSLWGAA